MAYCGIHISYRNSIYAQNNAFKLYDYSSGSVLGPRIIKANSYYEFTHFNGSNFHLFGYNIGARFIYAYPQGQNFYGVWNLVDMPNGKAQQKLNENIPVKTTVGIGYSTFKKIFYIIYQETVVQIPLNNVKESDEIIPGFVEGNVKNIFDYVSINFGQQPFKYNLKGFKSYCYFAVQTLPNTRFYINLLLYSCLILVEIS